MFTSHTKEDFENEGNDNQQEAVIETPKEELPEKYQLERCVTWIRENKFEKPCLQFPQHLLNDGTSIVLYLQKALEIRVYLLADTAYGSCCVDEVAAEHVHGDSIIHFGHACLSPVTKLPVLYIFEKGNLNLRKMKKDFETFEDNPVVVFYEDIYYHLYDELRDIFSKQTTVNISKLILEQRDPDKDNQENYKEKIMCGRIFFADVEAENSAVFIGNDCVTLQNLVLGLPEFKWYRYTRKQELVEFHLDRTKFLMQRSHLVEKIKEANVIGILVGTLGIKNYLDVVEIIKSLAKKKGKKCYILAVGKPNVAKLANFPEIDVFVCVSCQENSLLKDFKNYFKPVVSFFEVEMALGNRLFTVEYSLDFRECLPGGSFHNEVVNEDDSNKSADEVSQVHSVSLMERDAGTIVESAGAQFLKSRSWQGLEQKLGDGEICKASKGRSGIPQAYENEITTLSNDK